MKFLLSALFLFSASVNARQIRIGVIDSGISYVAPYLHICKDGMYDLSVTKPGIDYKTARTTDELGHGSNVSYIIADHLKDVDYCMVIIKIYGDHGTGTSFYAHFAAYLLAATLDLDIVNYSSGGYRYSATEHMLISLLQKHGTKFVTAAGNDNLNVDRADMFYPCGYKDVICVGNLDHGRKHNQSNFGKTVTVWQEGTNVSAGGYTMSGTSQATAVETAVLVRQMYNDSLK